MQLHLLCQPCNLPFPACFPFIFRIFPSEFLTFSLSKLFNFSIVLPGLISVPIIGHILIYSVIVQQGQGFQTKTIGQKYTKHKQNKNSITGGHTMKGYIIDTGYMGLVNGKYMLFASEEEYRDYLDS